MGRLILNQLPDKSFQDLSIIASLIAQTPVCFILLHNGEELIVKSKYGAELSDLESDYSFWISAIDMINDFVEVEDTLQHSHFKNKSIELDKFVVRFFAGIPLLDELGNRLGAICLFDKIPKKLSKEQVVALKALENQITGRITLGKQSRTLKSTVRHGLTRLQESENKYQRLYESAPDMMCSVSSKTRKVSDCNATLCSVLGYSKQEITGQDVMQLYHPDCHEAVKVAFEEFVDKKEVKNRRLLLKKKNGDKLDVALSVKAILNEEGEVIYSSSVWRDVTDLVKTEGRLFNLNKELEEKVESRTKELDAQNEMLELALEGNKDGIWDRRDLNSDEEWWSPSFHKLLGYEVGEIEQSYSSFNNNLLHPEEVDQVNKYMEASLFDNAPFNMEHRLRLENGEYKWFRAKANVVRNKEGKPVRLTGSISDIHEAKMLEEELSTAKKFLTKVMDVAPSIIYVFNLETMQNEYSNREIGMVLGYSVEEIKKMGDQLIPSLAHPEDLSTVFQHFGKVSEIKDEETIAIEYRMKHKDGQYRWLLSEDAVFERNRQGKVLKHIGTATDVTKIKEGEELLKNQASKLRAQNEDLQQLAYVATHDLKSPMISIEGHFDYLKDKFDHQTFEIKESVGFVENGISQFHETINALTEAIRMKELRLNLEPVRLNNHLYSIVEKYKGQIEKIQGELKTNLTQENEVIGAELMIVSVLQNLITNAIKYRNPERNLVVEISAFEKDNLVLVEITDNGLGIDLELNKGKMFKMFNRFHYNKEGVGMGLYMVKTMMNKMKATVEVDSKKNLGTTFRLKFKKA